MLVPAVGPVPLPAVFEILVNSEIFANVSIGISACDTEIIARGIIGEINTALRSKSSARTELMATIRHMLRL